MQKLIPLTAAAIVVLIPARSTDAQQTYRGAAIDSAGRLSIVTSSGRVVRPPLDSGAVGVEQVLIARGGRVVGWVATYQNCCTSYPLPLRLTLRHSDGHRTVVGADLPIWQWAFVANGRRVVLRESPVHGDAPTHFELRDAVTGAALDSVDVHPGSGRLPAWARLVADSSRSR
jgi:hypothetical protein